MGSRLVLSELMEPGENAWPNRAVGVPANQNTNMLQRDTGVTVVMQQRLCTAGRGLMKRQHRLRRYQGTSRVDDIEHRRHQRCGPLASSDVERARHEFVAPIQPFHDIFEQLRRKGELVKLPTMHP